MVLSKKAWPTVGCGFSDAPYGWMLRGMGFAQRELGNLCSFSFLCVIMFMKVTGQKEGGDK